MSNQARDHEARTSEIGDVDEFTPDVLHRSRYTCAHFSKDADELAMFMKMLGIHPSQEGESVYATGHAPLPTSGGQHVHHLISTQPRTLPRVQDTPLTTLRRSKQKQHLNNPKGTT